MTRDEILALLDRRAEAWRRLDVGTLVNDYAPDAVIESPLAGGTTHGAEQIKQVFQTYFVAFPDLGMDVGDVLVDGQRAAVMATFTGTDRGGFMGMPPTGRHVTIPVVFLYEFKDGKIVRDRRVYDFTGLLIQIGTLKAKPA
jgi:steroid delta-isomerase-like uncharacterized protein